MKLILTRHGETLENKRKIMQGHSHGNLSQKGLKEVKKLSLRLKEEKLDVIFSSDLGRAVETTKEIARYHKGIKIHYVRVLRERNLGSFTGKKSTEVNWKNPPKNLETLQDMEDRIKKFLDKIYDKYPDKVVLFVGHAGINTILTRLILKKPLCENGFAREHKKQANTALSIFEIKEDKNHKILLLNCTQHLRN